MRPEFHLSFFLQKFHSVFKIYSFSAVNLFDSPVTFIFLPDRGEDKRKGNSFGGLCRFVGILQRSV